MAVKDEYEVARLYTDGSFMRQMHGEFASWDRLEFHLAPPLVAGRDPATGRPRKSSYGERLTGVLRLLARMKVLRGTILDPFRYSVDRKLERRLLEDYREALDLLVEKISPANHAAAVAYASYPEKIRGYGPVKADAAIKALGEAWVRREALPCRPDRSRRGGGMRR